MARERYCYLTLLSFFTGFRSGLQVSFCENAENFRIFTSQGEFTSGEAWIHTGGPTDAPDQVDFRLLDFGAQNPVADRNRILCDRLNAPFWNEVVKETVPYSLETKLKPSDVEFA